MLPTRSGEATETKDASLVAGLIDRARVAQAIANGYDQRRADELACAAAWAILEPSRNRGLAELAVEETGLGNVEDKVAKNHRKTLGLLRDLSGARSVGVIAEYPDRGLIEIARPVGVVAALTPATNPVATPANKIMNALKGRNAIIVAPSPRAWSTAARLVGHVHHELDRIGAPRDLVQVLPTPVHKNATAELARLADLVVATGSQDNVRMASTSGTPTLGVGIGNVASIVDESADLAASAKEIVASKTFDHATSCSSENSLVIVETIADEFLALLASHGCVLVGAVEKAALAALMWSGHRLTDDVVGQSATVIAERAGLPEIAAHHPRVLMVSEHGVGPGFPFSREKLSPVLAVFRVPTFEAAVALVERIYAYQGAGHSVGLHSTRADRALALGQRLPVARVIVNQPHCFATGGSFENGLPFSLSMGCGTWGRNHLSENLTFRNFLNITRVVTPIVRREPRVDQLLAGYFERHGR